eukprot:CAMPEP_0201281834 /NCGR_PEP_ID=MMETSP1317-20130820/4172_1 /ASSEMBLY_ACC=CAM_ASM_000770 /TAXON_ID=187299 /ORGANISM="Undescribed Undescribed, Strain Undescribed" /LENGTH=97 /DNA_ID=CAMNT_0047592851 /DNA_START=258 /DNA_END=551 /DNA_ORIENTATION=-
MNLISAYEIPKNQWWQVKETLPVEATFLGSCPVATNKVLFFGYYLEHVYEWTEDAFFNAVGPHVEEGSTFNIYDPVWRDPIMYCMSYTGKVWKFDSV